MSFVTLTTGEIASGEPVTGTMLTKVKGNFDNHETRIEDLEGSVAQDPPMIFRVNGPYYVWTDVLKITNNVALTLSGVRVLIDVAGSAGTTEVNILKKRGAGAFTTIFTTRPSVGFAAGNDALSTNGVLDPTQVDYIAGDILRLDITANQTGATGLTVRTDYTR